MPYEDNKFLVAIARITFVVIEISRMTVSKSLMHDISFVLKKKLYGMDNWAKTPPKVDLNRLLR